MLRVLVCALSLAILASSAPSQSTLAQLMEDRFAAADEGDIHAFLDAAARAGLVRTAADRSAAKGAFRSYLAKNADAIALVTHQMAQARLLAGGAVGPANGTDLECNDLSGFADTLIVNAGGNCVVNGTVGSTDLRDVYRVMLTGGTPDHSVVIATVPAGTSTAPPATLSLGDANQRFILNGTVIGTTRSIAGIGLPDGSFLVTVAGTGTYTLTITSTGTTIPTLTNGTTGGFTMAPEVHTYRVNVGAPAEAVRIEVTNQVPSTGDYFFNLGRAKGGRVLFMDDTLVPPATTAQNDPLIEAQLPAGTYYLFLQEFFNATSGANYRISYGATPLGSVPSAIGANSYTMVHGGNYFLYSLPLAATARFSLVTTRAATGGDQVVEVLDAEMGQVLHCDDSATGLAGATLYPYADNTLPAGQYWVLARNFSNITNVNFGAAWTVTGTGALPVTLNTLGNRRSEPLSIPLGGHYAFTHTACTDTPLSAANTPTNFSLVGADGLLRGYFRNIASAGTAGVVGTYLRQDEVVYGNLMSLNYAATTIASVYLSGNLGIDLAPVSPTGAYQLKGEDKIGNTHYLFLSVGQGPGFVPGSPFRGRLCLDLLTLTPLLFHTFATDCRVNYTTTYFAGLDLRPYLEPAVAVGLRFQAVTLPALQFTNIAQ